MVQNLVAPSTPEIKPRKKGKKKTKKAKKVQPYAWEIVDLEKLVLEVKSEKRHNRGLSYITIS